eukprot:364426-Chlamydomonas_euryale.AAC.14
MITFLSRDREGTLVVPWTAAGCRCALRQTAPLHCAPASEPHQPANAHSHHRLQPNHTALAWWGQGNLKMARHAGWRQLRYNKSPCLFKPGTLTFQTHLPQCLAPSRHPSQGPGSTADMMCTSAAPMPPGGKGRTCTRA